jgi:hypothetical protein
MPNNNLIAFFQGATGAGLFGKLRRPGAPTEFIDSRSVEEYIASGDFERTLSCYRIHISDRSKQSDHESIWKTLSNSSLDGYKP